MWFATCAGLTQSLNAARATGADERKLTVLAKVLLLIIDDFGLKPLRTPTACWDQPRWIDCVTTPIAWNSMARPNVR